MMNKVKKKWYEVLDKDKISTPGLLISEKKIKSNIKSMIDISGDPNRLWPHIKTHKMPGIIDIQIKYGIKKFKCATIGELEMLSKFDIREILLSNQLTFEKLEKFIKIQKKYPKIRMSTLVDNSISLKNYSEIAEKYKTKINLWIDINNGMNRTGIKINEKIYYLLDEIYRDPNLNIIGLHVYDGHIRNTSIKERKKYSDKAFKPILSFQKKIESEYNIQLLILAGGSPTFLAHSKRKGIFLSPGTTLLWDVGYSNLWPDSPFKIAAVLVSRIISKPNKNLLCLDLGHKSVASEMPLPRVIVKGLENSKHISQSEEHLVIKSENANKYNVGDLLFSVPYHICPTVVKYNKVQVIEKKNIIKLWEVGARDYLLNEI